MKKIFLIFIALLAANTSFSQGYRSLLGNQGDTVNIWGVLDETELYDIKFVFVSSEDTVIGSTSYRIVDMHEQSLYFMGQRSRHFMHEDTTTKKVYVLDETSMTDVLLYDFSLSVGDSIYLQFGDTSVALPTGVFSTNMKDSWFKIKNDFTISSVLDTNRYRVLYLESDSMVADADTVPQSMYWVEGIGCITTLDYRNGLYPLYQNNLIDVPGFIPRCNWSSTQSSPVISPQYIYQKTLNGNCVFRADSLIKGFCTVMSGMCPCATTITGIAEEKTTNHNFKLYPNPADDVLTLKMAHVMSGFSYSIYNTQGSIVFSGFANSNDIDVSGLKPGLYFIKINGSGQAWSERFVKN